MPVGNVSGSSPASHSLVRSSGSNAVVLVDVDDGVELVGQSRVEVVRDALALRLV